MPIDDRAILILEDDLDFASLVLEVSREQGFKGLIATRSHTGWTIWYEIAKPVDIEQLLFLVRVGLYGAIATN